ncbi:MAG: hypothetical protein ACKVP7_22530 [Hyphomicrobiaceae bacterium]
MALKDTLDATRAASAKRIPPEKQAIMAQATNDLRQSGILAKVAAVGQKAPAFQGQAFDGRAINSGDLLGRGAVALSFFRGHW